MESMLDFEFLKLPVFQASMKQYVTNKAHILSVRQCIRPSVKLVGFADRKKNDCPISVLCYKICILCHS